MPRRDECQPYVFAATAGALRLSGLAAWTLAAWITTCLRPLIGLDVLKPSGRDPDSFEMGLDRTQSIWMVLKQADVLKLVFSIHVYT